MIQATPTICGEPDLYIPEQDCTECDRLQQQIDELNEKTDALDVKIDSAKSELNERITNEVNTLNERITSEVQKLTEITDRLDESLTALSERVTALSERVTTLESGLEEANGHIDSLNEALEPYSDTVLTKANEDGTTDTLHVLGYEDEAYEPPSRDPYFIGTDDVTICLDEPFDPKAGVEAYDYDGVPIETFEVTGTEDLTTEGMHYLIYSATDTQQRTGTTTRQVEVIDCPIKWSGVTDMTVKVNQEFDPADGVTATGCNESPAAITVLTDAEEDV